MQNRVVKQGPFVFLKDLVTMESVLFIILFLASFVENYEMLYKDLGMARFLHYNLFVLIASSLFQILFLTVLFANWYLSYFEIGEKEIIKKSGLFFRRKKSISLLNIVSVETYQTPFDRLMNHASIVIEQKNGRKLKMKNVPNFSEYVAIIKRNLQNLSRNAFPYNVESLIRQSESLSLEFKETLRYDTRRNEVNKEMEKAVIKSIVGFLNNNDGGVILVGVNDKGEMRGLKRDYESLPKKNRDGFENHLNALVKTMIGLPFAKYVNISFENVEGEDVCVINVRNSHKPAYLKNGSNKEEFFVRIGNSTEPFSMSESAEYIKTNFRE